MAFDCDIDGFIKVSKCCLFVDSDEDANDAPKQAEEIEMGIGRAVDRSWPSAIWLNALVQSLARVADILNSELPKTPHIKFCQVYQC